MIGVMIQTAILVAAILAVRKVFGKRLHAYVQYGLWLFVVFRLLLPVNFIDSPLSVLHIVETASARYEEPARDDIAAEAGRPEDSRDGMTKQKERLQADDNIQASEADQTGNKIQTNKADQAGNNTQANKADQAGNNMQINEADRTDSNVQIDETDQTDSNIQIDETDQTDGNIQVDETYQSVNDKRINGTKHLADILYVPYVRGVVQAVRLMGSLIVGSFLGISHFCFRRRLRRTRAVYLGNIPDAARKKRVPIYRVKGLESPCLAGLFRPAIYIGTDIDMDSDSFRYAVIHEEVHYLHRDHIWAVVRAVLVTVYWFHPFVWIAAAASARDGEIACEYGTVQRIGQEERFAYGEMLLLFSQTKRGKRVYSYGTMLRPGRSELKERILRLTQTKGSRMWAGILTAVFMVVLVGCAFTGAAVQDSENQGQEGAVNLVLKNPADKNSGNGNDISSENEGNASNVENSENNLINKNDVNYEHTEDNRNEEQNETITEPRQLEAVSADISEETPFGADGPTLDYAGNWGTRNESIVIFHDYFGLIVYDLTNQKVIRCLELSAIGCNMTQGDDVCQTAVSADGTVVWLHPMSKQYKYRYDVEKDLLYQEPLVKTFSIDLEGEDLFDRYLVTEEITQKYVGWRSNYLYEEYKDEQGLHKAYIYLYLPNGEEPKLGNLQCHWDDMEFILQWDNADGQSEQAAETGEFPYDYDGIVNKVEVIYDEPCDYTRISDTYGGRVHPVTQEVRMHEGIDYAAESGTDIVAAADGVVYETGYSATYGNYVVLLHINGDMTYYCQCEKVIVEKGAQVKRGEKIATVGSTGRSTGSHLHFALSRNGAFVDPAEHMRVVVELD